MAFMSEKVDYVIGNYIGEFWESDPSYFEGLAKTFMPLKVSMDIHKPIACKMKIKRDGGCWLAIM